MRAKIIACFLVFLLLSVSACKVGPDYVKPKVLISDDYKEAPEGWKIATPSDEIDRGCWWEVFNDPLLNDLEQQVNVCNQNIAVSEAQYWQARSLVDQAIAGYFPMISATVSDTRQKFAANDNGLSGINGLSTRTPNQIENNKPFTTYLLSVNATWEPDLWGLVRQTVEANETSAEASVAQLALTRLSMQASLATFYFQLRTLDLDQKLLNETVAAYQKSLALTQNRYKSGVASRLDVLQADTQLKNAEVLAIDNGILRAQYEHAIAVLIGKPPACFSLPCMPLNATPPTIPVSLPSCLLERRPDIASAERQVASANEQIGIAMTPFFPALLLTGIGGYQANRFERWFDVPSSFWSLGAQFTQLIFDAGLNKAKKNQACAVYDQMVANYRQTVLAAMQDVEDNLVSLRILENEAKAQRDAVKDAEGTLNFAMNQYKSGTVDYLNVLTAQNTLYNAKKALNDIAGRRMVSALGLIRSLGGGFDYCDVMKAPRIKPKGDCHPCKTFCDE